MELKQFSMPVFLLCLAIPSQVKAEGVWTLGLIGRAETGYYINQDDEIEGLPYLAYDTKRFHFGLDGIAYHAFQADNAKLSVLLAPRLKPDYPDDTIFSGLNRDTAVELGFEGRYDFGVGYVGATGLFDISDAHNGYEVLTKLGFTHKSGAFSLDASIGVRHRSKELNQYLFGVTAAEATATRVAFQSADSTTGIANLRGVYSFKNRVSLVGDITFEDLGSMRKSPLVNKNTNTTVALGLIYQF